MCFCFDSLKLGYLEKFKESYLKLRSKFFYTVFDVENEFKTVKIQSVANQENWSVKF